ncbi:hypothetical protein A1O7_06790 [Cladophialophora yegresii CBS 114405]|uniref:Uncharacterized protein n=1 Tax=Cladophialophora yegresii CBS 114405 TaxID=1182544 RepID=W9VW45_9EURO|nr:uncharacterized protein A1O7_06790 [Cladophialophora yegresii CBS 114405]EXJ56446.1 hypothetical protein A1O7_06790 [Cladophialophora yegresii CBS 114405]
MAGFDVICFIQLMCAQTLQELAKLSDQPLNLPEMPSIVTTGERLYETNLRGILRYLKQVHKACKRQGLVNAAVEVLAHRATVKQFHDVNDWVVDLLMTLEVPVGVKGLVGGDITAQDLRDYLNGVRPQILHDSSRADISTPSPLSTTEDPLTDAKVVARSPDVREIYLLPGIE